MRNFQIIHNFDRVKNSHFVTKNILLFEFLTLFGTLLTALMCMTFVNIEDEEESTVAEWENK